MTAFLMMLTPGGAFAWAKSLSGDRGSAGYGVAVDAAGSVYATGFFRGVTDFDPGPASATLKGISQTVFVRVLKPNGQFDWAVKMGGADSEYGEGIAANASGLYTAGFFFGTADFDPGPARYNLATGFNTAIFVSKPAHAD